MSRNSRHSPSTCPHGNPIPGTDRNAETLTTLDTSEPGAHIRLARITEQVEIDLESLTYLGTHGFIPGRSATVRSKAPDGTLVLELDMDESTIALGPALAANLYIAAA